MMHTYAHTQLKQMCWFVFSYFWVNFNGSSLWKESTILCILTLWERAYDIFVSASLVDCTRKKFFWLGVRIFCEWHHKRSSFGVILAHVAWPRAKRLGQSVLLKFSLETRLESESFEPLIDFLAFLVQKLWSKINKLINYLIS